jgi:HTH-type transcriptional regulator/antitoxin HigA
MNLGKTLNPGARKTMAVKREQYLDLVRQFPLRPIRSEEELDRAIKVIDSLIDCPSRNADQDDYLSVLSDLVEAYEEKHYPMPEVSDARMLRHLIEAKGVSQTKVARATGIANSTISAVLKGVRQLTREHIGQLAKYFHVDPGAFAFGEQQGASRKVPSGIRLRRSKSFVET